MPGLDKDLVVIVREVPGDPLRPRHVGAAVANEVVVFSFWFRRCSSQGEGSSLLRLVALYANYTRLRRGLSGLPIAPRRNIISGIPRVL